MDIPRDHEGYAVAFGPDEQPGHERIKALRFKLSAWHFNQDVLHFTNLEGS